MAARLVSSIMTILQLRGCCSRYFLTVFLDSPTLMARRTRPLPASSWPILSTKAASSAQKPHQVVQNSRRTTLPLMESLEKFSARNGMFFAAMGKCIPLARAAVNYFVGTLQGQTQGEENSKAPPC